MKEGRRQKERVVKKREEMRKRRREVLSVLHPSCLSLFVTQWSFTMSYLIRK